MLDNDNIISTSVSEAVKRIPTDDKDYRKSFFIAFYFVQPQHTKSRPTCIVANSKNSCLPTRIYVVLFVAFSLSQLQLGIFYLELSVSFSIKFKIKWPCENY